MIMKKFEMLDKILEASQKGLFKEPPASKPKKGRPKRDKDDYAYEKPTPPPPRPPEEPLGPDQLLTEHQLSLLFKMTSSFNVPADGILDYAYDGFYEPDQFDYSDEEKYVAFKLFLIVGNLKLPFQVSFQQRWVANSRSKLVILWVKMNFSATMVIKSLRSANAKVLAESRKNAILKV